jgi:hypothetical protein
MRPSRLIALAASGVLLSGCAVINPPVRESHDATGSHSPEASHSASGHSAMPTDTAPVRALRSGERFLTVGVADDLPAGTYAPQAPQGGTDDYRCFLVDPRLTAPSFVTGVAFLPGNPALVHHSILFRVEPAQVSAALAKDAADPRPGWECFGGPGLPSQSRNALDGLDAAPWLAGWAPGGRENVFGDGYGVPVSAGSRIVVQMHYNLRRTGDAAVTDDTHVRLRMSDQRGLVPMRTMLLPAPVELPCPDGGTSGLCNRGDAVVDVTTRFGPTALRTIGGLQLLCGGDPFAPKSGATQTCVRTVREPVTVRAAAGHMHLLGKSLRIEANAGTPRARTLVDIPVWDFDNQGARQLASPVRLRKGDTVTITCTHDATLRDKLPALQGTPPRYVVWGEGTTDEMCLGILIVTD